MPPFNHYCDVEAEPLHRYCPGGYHPVHLGDVYNNGRYKVLHKLGFGGFSTAWIARDQLLSRYVALKIVASNVSPQSRELQVLRTIARDVSSHPGRQHVVRLLNDFSHTGPNGVHTCLVLELLGPSVPAVIEEPFTHGRLPGVVARRVCKETLRAIDFLHKQGIGHGDLHTGNVVFAILSLDSLSEEALYERLGHPETGLISPSEGVPPAPGMPDYLVWPANFPVDEASVENASKLIDFGESFLPDDKPQALHTPLALRAPELLLEDEWDLRVDLWALGCMIFELVVGQPPFSGIVAKKQDILQQMIDTLGELPVEWQPR